MTAATDLRAVLAAHAGLVALVSDRIRADLADELDATPFVVFKRVGIEPTYGLDNSELARKETFQVECWGDTRGSSSDVAEQVIAALKAAGLPPSPSDPDALDPDIGARAVVLNVEIWT